MNVLDVILVFPARDRKLVRNTRMTYFARVSTALSSRQEATSDDSEKRENEGGRDGPGAIFFSVVY